jgi:transposase InsO family protein
VHRKRPELWPSDRILHHDNVPAHKALSVRQFLPQKSITIIEHTPYSPDLFPKVNPTLRGRRFQDESIKKCDDGNESYSVTGVRKMFPTVAASMG